MQLSDLDTKDLTDGMSALSSRGNASDEAIFDRLKYWARHADATTYLSRGGIPKPVTRKDHQQYHALSHELALILSWRIGWTVFFWERIAGLANRAAGLIDD